MPTVAELADSVFQETAWLLVVEGWPVMFTDYAALAGSGDGTWLGQIEADVAARVVHGLTAPAQLKFQSDYDASSPDSRGLFKEDSVTLQVEDHEGILIGYAQEQEPASLLQESLFPAGAAPAGKWIVHEAIRGDGGRRRFPCIPGTSLPGEHWHADPDWPEQVPAVPVFSAPTWVEGQRCALFLLRRDPHGTNANEALNWPSLTAQEEGGARVWWGRIRRGKLTGRRWSIPASGVASWLRKPLFQHAWTETRTLTARLEYPAEQYADYFAFYSQMVDPSAGVTEVCQQGDGTLPASPTYQELVESLNTQIASIIIGANDPDFNNEAGGAEFEVGYSGFSIRKKKGDPDWGARVYLVLHHVVLRWLGFVPDQQKTDRWATKESEYNVTMEPLGGQLSSHYRLMLDTSPVGRACLEEVVQSGEDATVHNGWTWREYKPISPPHFLLDGDPGNTWYSLGTNVPYLALQGLPQIADHWFGGAGPKLNDSGPATIGQAFLLTGQRLLPGKDEAEEYAVVALGYSSSNAGTYPLFSEGDDLQPAFALLRWFMPPMSGYPWQAPSNKGAAWPGNMFGLNEEASISVRPVAMLGWQVTDALDSAADVFVQTLIGTGSGRWSYNENDPEDPQPIVGSNDPGDPNFPWAIDIAHHSVSLSIPHEMVDLEGIYEAFASVPLGLNSPLNKVKLFLAEPTQSEDVLRWLLGPRDICMGIKGGKYTAFALSAPLDPSDAVITINGSDLSGEDVVPEVELRPTSPIDAVTVRYGHAPAGPDDTREHRVVTRDSRRSSRAGNSEIDIEARGLPAPEHYALAEVPEVQRPADWRPVFDSLWADRVASWAARPHVMVSFTLRPPKSLKVQVGSIVIVTDPWVPSLADGEYGIQAVAGRVLSYTLNTKSLEATVEILLDPHSVNFQRRFAPAAVVLDNVPNEEDRYDPATRTFYVHADYWTRKHAANPDCAWFVAPAWSGLEGSARVDVWQTDDGETWTKTMSSDVDSVNTTANTISLKAAGLTGTFRTRSPALIALAPWGQQEENGWVRALLLPTVDTSGTIDGVTPGFKWVDWK